MIKNGMTTAVNTDNDFAENTDDDYNYSDEMDELTNQVTDKLSDANKSDHTVG